jgi:hypothetical protein
MRVAYASRAKPFVSPVQPENRPNAVAGETNGLMPSRDLIGVAPNCLAARAAAPSLGLLLATAREEGVVLGAEECYRPLSGQVAVKKSWTSAGNSACAAAVRTTSTGKPVGTSMHGWGKAADLRDAHGGLRFGSPTYRFLTKHAGRFGWNHPAWARPGGSSCPEAWHWEWVGDGGVQGGSTVLADVVTLLPAPYGMGYSIVTGLGAVHPHGHATDHRRGSDRYDWLVVAAARTPDGGGYWLVCGDGSVHAFGTARNFGSTRASPPAHPVVGIAPAATGGGYWLASSAGNVIAFGAAGFFGSPAAAGTSLHRPIVAIASTPDGRGYWLAGADGRVYAYGNAALYGDASRRGLRVPVVSMASTPDGTGYWLATAKGRVLAYGSARSFGSIPRRLSLRQPVMAIASTPAADGYWMVTADGSVFAFGDAGIYRR